MMRLTVADLADVGDLGLDRDVRWIDGCLAALFDERPRFAGLGINLQQSDSTPIAGTVDDEVALAVFTPEDEIEIERIMQQAYQRLSLSGDGFAGGDVDDEQ